MKNIFLTLLCALSLLSITGCSNDDPPKDTLPEATTIGANTAGCYIDGKLLVPKDGDTGFTGTAYGLTVGGGNNFNAPIIGDDYFYVRIVNHRDRPTYSIWLQIDDMSDGEGAYPFGQANGLYFMDGPNNPFAIVMYYDGVNVAKTYYSSENSGNINITQFDYYNGIYSGTFNLTLYNKDNPTDTIEITEGRFDIRIATLNQD